jgi:radical SAM protein with 4Fe4S-binding SPASM domain
MKTNKDYFSLTSWYGRLKYFFGQGNIVAHIIDRIKWHYFPKYEKVARFPTHLDVELASACQLRCPMCPTGNGMMSDSIKGIMQWWVFKKIIDEAAKNGVYSIKLSWRGEPHLNKSIWKMVRYAKSSGIKDVSTLSNGESMTDIDLQELVDSGLDWISFSVDGMEDSYNRIRHPAKFYDLVDKVKKINEIKKSKGQSKPLIRVQTILSTIEHDPAEFFSFWESLVDRVNCIADEDRADDMRNFPRDPDFVCPSPWQRMTIGYDGQVFPCVSDYLSRDPVGDVKFNSLSDIWVGKKMTDLREAHSSKSAIGKYASCGDCCHGGLMEDNLIKIKDRTINIRKYVGQDPNVKRMGGREVPDDGKLWYEGVQNPKKGKRGLKPSKNKNEKN